MKAVAAALALLLPAAALAATDPLYALYAQGAYEQAARAGEAAHSAAGYALAARAVLADASLRGAPCLECFRRAETLARRAVAIDPGLAWGQLWLAVALGQETRLTGILKARLDDTPAQSKAALNAAVKAEPDNPFAVSALGGWDVEVVKGGGSFLAYTLYGATTGHALTLFDRAVALAPHNVAVRYQIGLTLAGLDAKAYRDRIATNLQAAIDSEPASAYERAMQLRARDLLGLLTPTVQDGLAARVRKYQGYPD